MFRILAVLVLLALALPAAADTCYKADPNGMCAASVFSTVATPLALDIATVTTGSTAVVAINAGHAVRGAWITNPTGSAQPLCISEITTATTTSGASTTCIAAGQTYTVQPQTGAVSVNSTDSSHTFTGRGYQ